MRVNLHFTVSFLIFSSIACFPAKEWTFPMKYVDYIHACVLTLLVGKHHRVVH